MRKAEERILLYDRLRPYTVSDIEFDDERIGKEYNNKDAAKAGPLLIIITIFGSILAASLFVGFLGLTNILESGYATLAFGLAMIALAIWMDSLQDAFFMIAASTTVLITGLTLFVFGWSTLNLGADWVYAIFLLISVMILLFSSGYLFSFIAILAANGSCLMWIYHHHELFVQTYLPLLTLLTSFFFLHEAPIIAYNRFFAKRYEAIKSGLLIALLLCLILVDYGDTKALVKDWNWVSSFFVFAALLYLVSFLIPLFEIKPQQRIWTYIVCLLVLAPTVMAPSIAGALLITLLSFRVNDKTGLVLGIMALIYFISLYYYDLQISLLAKSLILIGSGVLFILLYLFVDKKMHPDEKI